MTRPISFAGLLGLLFIGLKLAGHIDWSWWFVLLPLYIGPALVVSFFLFVITILLFVLMVLTIMFFIGVLLGKTDEMTRFRP